MNRVCLTGRLTKKLDLRTTQSGTSCTSFTLAVNRRIKAEGQPDADFIRCTAWGKTAEVMCQYLTKGSQIGVEGRIQTGQFQDKNGNTVFTTDVVVEQITFIGSGEKKSNNTAQNNNSYNDDYAGYDDETLDITSDDLPF